MLISINVDIESDKLIETFVSASHFMTFSLQVVCSECSHVSVTFEPFMYLSVPLPHATDRQISTYLSVSSEII